MRPGPRWEGWRFGALVGGLIGCIGLASWPIIIHPMMYPETYRQIQAVRGSPHIS
ncbi:unnamed protein product [Nesidiocoris tenuis]|uniref:Uncharacterized protein n=1 Tax=Nesidiocoris tenuis TaxID=355587 RepID=A0A6H5HQV7_9HEMI|nr:unnamed protein product [Nesidiocoris tenuis]